LDLRRTARIGLGLFESGPFDLVIDGGDWVAGFCFPLRLAEAAAPVPAAENSPETRGAGALRVLGTTWVAGEVGEGAGNLPVGTRSGQGHRMGASHGEAARRWR
jgi:hypothetical protein